MTNKPLKTVEELLKELAVGMYFNGRTDVVASSDIGVTPNNLAHAEPIMNTKVKDTITQLNNHYKELFLSIIGEDEGVVSADDIEDFDVHRLAVERTKIGRNKLRAELREELSEHFNGEGKV